MDFKQGLLCGLTDKMADFTDTCPTYEPDEQLEQKATEHVDEIRDNSERAKMAQRLIWFLMFMSVLSICSSFLHYNLLARRQDIVPVSAELIEVNDQREAMVNLVIFVALVVAATVYIRWFRRAYYNLAIRTEVDHDESWTVWGWIIPIISLFRPLQLMKEMWSKTTALVQAHLPNYQEVGSTLVVSWWVLWIIVKIGSNISTRLSIKAITFQDQMDATSFDILLAIVSIPLALLAIRVVKEYTNLEQTLYDLEIAQKQEQLDRNAQ